MRSPLLTPASPLSSAAASVPSSAPSACTLLALEQEHQTLLRALGRAQQRSSDAIQRMQQELQATRKAMQWWRTLALQHIPADVLQTALAAHTGGAADMDAVQMVWQAGLEAAQDCHNQCLSRQQLWRTATAQGDAWCLRDATACVLDAHTLPVQDSLPATGQVAQVAQMAICDGED